MLVIIPHHYVPTRTTIHNSFWRMLDCAYLSVNEDAVCDFTTDSDAERSLEVSSCRTLRVRRVRIYIASLARNNNVRRPVTRRIISGFIK